MNLTTEKVLMKAMPKFDIESSKWIIDIETEDGEIVPVGHTINKEIGLWQLSTWDSKKQAEEWIKSKGLVLK